MIRLIAIVIVLLIYAAIFAQAPDTLWTRNFNRDSTADWGYSVQQTLDGGYIVTGMTGSGKSDIWLIKTDANGDTLWTKTYGDSGSEIGFSVDTTSDGGYIITGYTLSFGAGNEDVWLIKTDANGDTLWTKTYGGDKTDIGNSVHQTSDGGYIITGYTFSFGAGNGDIWLIKTKANGDTMWTKKFGDTTYDEGFSAQQTNDGGYIITGYTGSIYGPGDLLLIKTDINGDILWTKTYGDTLGDAGFSVQQTTDNGFIISGTYNAASYGGYGKNPISYGYCWLLKTDSNGDTLWTKKIGENGGNSGRSVQQTTDGGYIITGNLGLSNFSADIWLIRTDGNGDTLWTKSFDSGTQDIGFSVKQTTDGGYIIAGLYNSDPWGDFADLWLIKIAPDVTAISKSSNIIIDDYHLKQNFPNPFNPSTTIEFSLPQADYVTLKVYNILGEEVVTLVSEKLGAGEYRFDWSVGDLTSGVYLYRMLAGNFVQTRKMIFMK